MNRNYAIIIPTHGRPDRLFTYNTLMKKKFTGKVYFLIDNEDDQADEYYRLFGDKVVMFDKKEQAEHTDICTLKGKRNAVVYARNAIPRIAKELGLDYYIVMDDDYVSFCMRWEDGTALRRTEINDLDAAIEETFKFLDESGVDCVAWAQIGDFIGGQGSGLWKQRLKRKIMNVFFCKTGCDFEFKGKINEDVNCYVYLGRQGRTFLTVRDFAIDQTVTQANAGGLTDIYLEQGTYIKSFYSVICCPSCVKVGVMGSGDYRFHHKINWERAVPKIISDKFRKK